MSEKVSGEEPADDGAAGAPRECIFRLAPVSTRELAGAEVVVLGPGRGSDVEVDPDGVSGCGESRLPSQFASSECILQPSGA